MLKLSECVKKYLEDEELNQAEFSEKVMDEFPDEPAYRKCRTTLNSSAKLESLVTQFTLSSLHKFSFVFPLTVVDIILTGFNH